MQNISSSSYIAYLGCGGVSIINWVSPLQDLLY